jgi:hypothetical protein
MPIGHTYPSGWGTTGSTAPADDADPNTVSPSDYKANHTGYYLRRLTANATNATLTVTDISATDLTVAVAASKNYLFRIVLFYTTNATTTAARFSVNGPASPTLLRLGGMVTVTPATAGSAAIAEAIVTAYDTSVSTHATGPGATPAMAIIEGTLVNGVNAGNLRPRFASSVAVASGLIVLAGSYMEVREFDN